MQCASPLSDDPRHSGQAAAAQPAQAETAKLTIIDHPSIVMTDDFAPLEEPPPSAGLADASKDLAAASTDICEPQVFSICEPQVFSPPPMQGSVSANVAPWPANESPEASESPIASDPQDATPPSPVLTPAQQHLKMAQDDPGLLLKTALDRWKSVEGYHVKVLSQERLEGKLRCQTVIEATVMSEPYAVSFRWLANAGEIDKLLWMPSAYGKELIVHPTGLAGKFVDHVRVNPYSDRVKSSSRRDVTQFGLAQTLQSLLEGYQHGHDAGTLTSQCLGLVKCEGVSDNAIALRQTTTDRHSEVQLMFVYFNPDDLRPLRVQQFAWDGQLLGCYDFTDYRPIQLSKLDFSLDVIFN
jgi:hypothetical protein